jgi:hypothetical protein
MLPQAKISLISPERFLKRLKQQIMHDSSNKAEQFVGHFSI